MGELPSLTVHGIVNPVVDVIDLFAKMFGVEIQAGLIGRKKLIEGGVEEADDL